MPWTWTPRPDNIRNRPEQRPRPEQIEITDWPWIHAFTGTEESGGANFGTIPMGPFRPMDEWEFGPGRGGG